METEKVSLEITNDSNREKYFNLDKNHEEINEAETIETTMSKEPIAIVGIGGKMPQSVNLEDFWGNLIKGKDLITEIPSDRWNWKDYYGDPIKENNKTNVIREVLSKTRINLMRNF
ncbi:beta-ketoacyl synthase N-terminal-like domain-containing protein [Priestia megaterium]